MELQLGLALPSSPIKGFDLNTHFYDPKELVSAETRSYGCCFGIKNNKRSFEDAFEKTRAVTETLPLLLWNDKSNEEDDRKGIDRRFSSTITEDDGEGDSLVGWPPIKARRMKLQHQSHGGCGENERREERGNGGSSNSMYVKVKMEGVGIGRKVDLSLHRSYQTLTDTLINMFGKYQRSVRGTNDGTRYTLTYQDREGDWLLAGDVPWQTFMGTVKRLKIQRNGG